MKFCNSIALALSLVGVSQSFTVSPMKNGLSFIRTNGVTLKMSDSQPSDSSSEELYDTVDVESTDYEPTTNESIVNSLLDEIPATIMGDISKETRSKVNEALLKLETVNPEPETASSPLLNGVWTLRYAGGYASEGALASPTRQLALFLYSGGYSPGLFALSLAEKLPGAVADVGELTISISRTQPRIEASVPVTLFGSTNSENKVIVKAGMTTESAVRFTETYESASVFGQEIEIPEAVQYTRELMVTYVDEDILVVRDASGVPEILVRKAYGS